MKKAEMLIHQDGGNLPGMRSWTFSSSVARCSELRSSCQKKTFYFCHPHISAKGWVSFWWVQCFPAPNAVFYPPQPQRQGVRRAWALSQGTQDSQSEDSVWTKLWVHFRDRVFIQEFPARQESAQCSIAECISEAPQNTYSELEYIFMI